jgi:hypothetical protein
VARDFALENGVDSILRSGFGDLARVLTEKCRRGQRIVVGESLQKIVSFVVEAV